MVTYADALAACTARWGEPTSRDLRAERPTVAWVARPAADGWADSYWLEGDGAHVLLVALVGAEDRTWLLAGDDPLWPERALTPLPAALDAAEAWLRGARSARG